MACFHFDGENAKQRRLHEKHVENGLFWSIFLENDSNWLGLRRISEFAKFSTWYWTLTTLHFWIFGNHRWSQTSYCLISGSILPRQRWKELDNTTTANNPNEKETVHLSTIKTPNTLSSFVLKSIASYVCFCFYFNSSINIKIVEFFFIANENTLHSFNVQLKIKV